MTYYGEILNKHVQLDEGFNLSMVNDSHRLDMFKLAFKDVNLKDKVVCDLGAGTGILGLEALEQGASHVYLVEISKSSITYLREIVEHHPSKEKITIIAKDICDLTLIDFNHTVDVFCSETFGGHLYNEGMIIYFEHVLQLFPNAATIPEKIGSRFLVCESDFSDSNLWPQLGHPSIIEGYKKAYDCKMQQLHNSSVELMEKHILNASEDLALFWTKKSYNDSFLFANSLDKADVWLLLRHQINYSKNVICNWSITGWYFKELANDEVYKFNILDKHTPQLTIDKKS